MNGISEGRYGGYGGNGGSGTGGGLSLTNGVTTTLANTLIALDTLTAGTGGLGGQSKARTPRGAPRDPPPAPTSLEP